MMVVVDMGAVVRMLMRHGAMTVAILAKPFVGEAVGHASIVVYL